ncbi:MAG: DUF3488 and transglutaminase-like domain-containing protein [Gammaproteobacteria bacterium]|nr:DUF3488 and transglutaminase-like domain-containing protein [Gammaproteobacteria bacterium]
MMIWRSNHAANERRTENPLAASGQIIWLIGTLLIVSIPHWFYLHLWVPIVVIAILAWRTFAALKRWPLPSNWVRVPLTLLGFVVVLFSYRSVSGLSAGSALLLVMASLKLLETRGHRDRAIVIFICYFLLFAAFLREQSLWSSSYLIAGVLATTAAMFQTARIGSVIPATQAIRIAGRLLLQALPIALLLFLLFPRIPGPFWSLPTGDKQARSGLSSELNPGDISELTLSDDLAFRVRFLNGAPEPVELYWRGPVMDQFDGRKWFQTPNWERTAPDLSFADTARIIEYELTLEPHGQRWLLALETPFNWDAPRARLSAEQQLLNPYPVERRVSYRSASMTDRRLPAAPNNEAIERALRVPSDLNRRSLAFAQKLRQETPDEARYLERILQHFNREGFRYTLRPPLLGDNPVDEFMFESRRGFCGHYASAFAFLARAGGIPARIVTGYQGGNPNPLSNYWIVRQSDAHAWVEVWLNESWVRYDPTGAVAPDRIEYGFDTAMDRLNQSTGTRFRDNPWITRLAMSWDAVHANWNRWILGFGPETQAKILNFFGFKNPTVKHLIITLSLSVTFVMLLTGFAQHYRSKPKSDKLLSAYQLLCRKTGNAIRPKKPAEGPGEYLETLCVKRPELATELQSLFNRYIQLRYDGNKHDLETNKIERKQLIRAIRRFNPKPV